MATLPPTSLPSRLSPTNTEIPYAKIASDSAPLKILHSLAASDHAFHSLAFRLWTYKQLKETGSSNLKTRALNLKQAIAKADWVPGEFANSLRTNGENTSTIRWILEVQSALLRGKFSAHDFGLPLPEGDEDSPQYFEGQLPSIKRTHKTIMSTSPKKGAQQPPLISC